MPEVVSMKRHPKCVPTERTLKVEEHGDPYHGRIKPKIRLLGLWLERCGFAPGTRVLVRSRGDGVLELRSTSLPVT